MTSLGSTQMERTYSSVTTTELQNNFYKHPKAEFLLQSRNVLVSSVAW